MGFYGLFYVANQKASKAIDNFRVILKKIHLRFSTSHGPHGHTAHKLNRKNSYFLAISAYCAFQ